MHNAGIKRTGWNQINRLEYNVRGRIEYMWKYSK